MSVRREAANVLPIIVGYQRQCFSVGVHLGQCRHISGGGVSTPTLRLLSRWVHLQAVGVVVFVLREIPAAVVPFPHAEETAYAAEVVEPPSAPPDLWSRRGWPQPALGDAQLAALLDAPPAEVDTRARQQAVVASFRWVRGARGQWWHARWKRPLLTGGSRVGVRGWSRRGRGTQNRRGGTTSCYRWR
jgi:hypothetical protein